jgi:predicted HTH domain antitoxin
MQVQVAIPDDLAHQLQARWGSLERKLLEMVVVEAYQEGSISTGKVRELLGLATRLEADAFLKAKGVYLQYDEAQLEEDHRTHDKLRQEGKQRAS